MEVSEYQVRIKDRAKEAYNFMVQPQHAQTEYLKGNTGINIVIDEGLQLGDGLKIEESDQGRSFREISAWSLLGLSKKLDRTDEEDAALEAAIAYLHPPSPFYKIDLSDDQDVVTVYLEESDNVSAVTIRSPILQRGYIWIRSNTYKFTEECRNPQQISHRNTRFQDRARLYAGESATFFKETVNPAAYCWVMDRDGSYANKYRRGRVENLHGNVLGVNDPGKWTSNVPSNDPQWMTDKFMQGIPEMQKDLDNARPGSIITTLVDLEDGAPCVHKWEPVKSVYNNASESLCYRCYSRRAVRL